MNWHNYYLGIAKAVAARGSCSRRKVGAVIVVDRAIVSTGYNGTPSGVTNCNEGGCARCAGTTAPGTGYELCLCVHAEQNAISQAARRGNATGGGTLYCTIRPCFGCVKSAVQAGIKTLVYEAEHEGAYTDLVSEATYATLIAQSGAMLLKMEPPISGPTEPVQSVSGTCLPGCDRQPCPYGCNFHHRTWHNT